MPEERDQGSHPDDMFQEGGWYEFSAVYTLFAAMAKENDIITVIPGAKNNHYKKTFEPMDRNNPPWNTEKIFLMPVLKSMNHWNFLLIKNKEVLYFEPFGNQSEKINEDFVKKVLSGAFFPNEVTKEFDEITLITNPNNIQKENYGACGPICVKVAEDILEILQKANYQFDNLDDKLIEYFAKIEKQTKKEWKEIRIKHCKTYNEQPDICELRNIPAQTMEGGSASMLPKLGGENSPSISPENFSELAQDFLERTYLHKMEGAGSRDYETGFKLKNSKPEHPATKTVARTVHGAMHACRVALYAEIMVKLYAKYGDSEAKAVVNNPQEMTLLKLAALCHDSARQAECRDTTKWEKQSTENLKEFLKIREIEITPRMSEIIDAAYYKDFSVINGCLEKKEKIATDGNGAPFTKKSIFQKAIHDADSLDIMRTKKEFNISFLDFYKDHVKPCKTHKNVAEQDIFQIVSCVAELIQKQGDLSYDLKVGITNHQGFQILKFDETSKTFTFLPKDKDLCYYKNFDVSKKANFENKKKCYEAIEDSAKEGQLREFLKVQCDPEKPAPEGWALGGDCSDEDGEEHVDLWAEDEIPEEGSALTLNNSSRIKLISMQPKVESPPTKIVALGEALPGVEVELDDKAVECSCSSWVSFLTSRCGANQKNSPTK